MLSVVRKITTHQVVVLERRPWDENLPQLIVSEGEELITCENLSNIDVDDLTYGTDCYALEQDGYGDYYFEAILSETAAYDLIQARPGAILTAKEDATTKTWDQLSVAQKKIIMGLEPTNEELGLV